MIHTDGQRLIAPTTEALHEFAKTIGLPKNNISEYYMFPCYKLDTPMQLQIAKGFGAIETNTQQLVTVIDHHKHTIASLEKYGEILSKILQLILPVKYSNQSQMSNINDFVVIDPVVVSPLEKN